MESMSGPVRFDTKIAVLLRDDLEVWQRLNITAFLVSGIGQRNPEVIGEPYADLFTTGNDRDNRAAVRAVGRSSLDLVGMAAYGPRGAVDKIVKGARMHP